MPHAKLRGRIVEKYGSLQAFGKTTGVSMTSIYNKINGKTFFTRDEVLKWCKLLDLEIADIGTYFFD